MNLRVIVKFEKNEVPRHAQTCDILYLTSKGSAIGTLLNFTLLAYASDEKLYSAPANVPDSS